MTDYPSDKEQAEIAARRRLSRLKRASDRRRIDLERNSAAHLPDVAKTLPANSPARQVVEAAQRRIAQLEQMVSDLEASLEAR